jgi:hypothetical protein
MKIRKLLENRQEVPIDDPSTPEEELEEELFESKSLINDSLIVYAKEEFLGFFSDLSVYIWPPKITILSYDLCGIANGFRVRGELSEFHVFENPGYFCWILKCLIGRQQNGQQGTLLVGGVNLFFVKVESALVAVRVDWSEYDDFEGWILDLTDETGYHPFLDASHRWDSKHIQVRVFDRNERSDCK